MHRHQLRVAPDRPAPQVLVDLDLKEAFPAGLAGLPPRVGEKGSGADLRWALEELRSREAIRIRCGGDDYRGADGKSWGRDRIAAGGWPFRGTFTGPIAGTADAPLYRTERWWRDDPSPATTSPCRRGATG